MGAVQQVILQGISARFFLEGSRDLGPTKLKKPDLKYVKKCFDIISNILNKNDIIVLESTVYPGVTKSYARKLQINNKLINNKDFFV